MSLTDVCFIFLGTGTSGGIPLIGCACDVCTSDDPRDTRTRSGACVRWTDPGGTPRTVLIDATPDLRIQALRHKLDRCDAIFFTHHHVDHIFGLDEVRRFNHVMGGVPIDIYAEDYTLEALRRVYRHVFEQEKNINKSFVASLIAHELREAEPVDVFGMRFTPIRLMHGRLPIFGFRIEPSDGLRAGALPIAYCTDTSSVPTQTWTHLEGLETLVLDGLRHRHHPTHMTIDRATEIALDVGAGRTFLTHIAHEVAHAETEATLPDGIHLSYDGLELRGPDA